MQALLLRRSLLRLKPPQDQLLPLLLRQVVLQL
jgi:hypothetical protein